MITPEIILYIKQQHAAGMLPHNIKLSLQSNGWQESDILEAFKQAGVEYSTGPVSTSNASSPVSNLGPNSFSTSTNHPIQTKIIDTPPRPIPVTILGILQYISGVFSLLGVALVIFGGVLLGTMSGNNMYAKIALSYSFYIAAVVLAVSIASFVAGHGLFKGKNYGRFILAYTILISPISQLIFSANITTGLKNISVGLAIGILILAYLFVSKKSSAFFNAHSAADSFRSNLIVTVIVLLISTAGVYAIKANMGDFLRNLEADITQQMNNSDTKQTEVEQIEETQTPQTIENVDLETQ